MMLSRLSGILAKIAASTCLIATIYKAVSFGIFSDIVKHRSTNFFSITFLIQG
nr:MAG TPA_asm: hypothetical protein [Caudoviricetes sp.]